jgi:hypothetical protein
MAITFPASPTTSQIFTSGNKSWIWDGVTWLAYGASLSPTVLKVDTTNARVGINNQSPSVELDMVGTQVIRPASTQDGIQLAGRAGGTGSLSVKLTPTTLTANRTLTLPDATGTVALTSDPGLILIKTQTVGSAVASVAVTGAFSADYDNYLIQIINTVVSANQPNLNIQMTGATSGYAFSGHYQSFASATLSGDVSTSATSFPIGSAGNGTAGAGRVLMDCTVKGPFITQPTFFSSQNASLTWNSYYNGYKNDTTSYTGFTILPSSGTITGGTIRVYGYRNS